MSVTPSLASWQGGNFAAWLRLGKQLDDAANRIAVSKVVALYLECSSGSGKSTTFVPEMMKQVWKGHPAAKGIVIARTDDEERLLLQAWGDDTWPKEVMRTGRLDMCSRAKFVSTATPDMFATATVVFCDVEVLSTTMDEMFWCRLIERAQLAKESSGKFLMICLCASHLSKRTVEAFRDKVDPQMATISYYDEPEIDCEQGQTDEWKDRVDWDQLATDADSRIVVLGGANSQLRDLGFPPSHAAHSIAGNDAVAPRGRTLLTGEGDKAKVLWVAEDKEWAITLPRVQWVFMDDCREDVLLDHALGLLVKDTRRLTKTELRRRESWLQRAAWWRTQQNQSTGSTGSTGSTRAMAVYTQHDLLQRADDCTRVSPAWNEGLPLTVLGRLCAWPKTNAYRMPCREIPSIPVWDLAIHQLQMACAVDSRHRPTDMGIMVDRLATEHGWGWAQACLMAFAKWALELRRKRGTETGLDQYEYIMLVMAAIIATEAEGGRMMKLAPGVTQWPGYVGAHDVRYDCCAGGAAENVWNGGLWLQVGIYRKLHNESLQTVHEDIEIDSRVVERIGQHMKSMSDVLGIEHFEPGQATIIDPDDDFLDAKARRHHKAGLDYVSYRLACAFASQMLLAQPQDLGSETASLMHVASGAPVGMSTRGDLVDMEWMLENNPEGFYLFSHRPMEPRDTLLVANCLTRMPRRVLEEMASDSSSKWPTIVLRSRFLRTDYVYQRPEQ